VSTPTSKDELQLMAAIAAEGRLLGRRCAKELAEEQGMHPRRAEYIYEKWIRKGWWECGISRRTGWLTEAGWERAAALGEDGRG